ITTLLIIARLVVPAANAQTIIPYDTVLQSTSFSPLASSFYQRVLVPLKPITDASEVVLNARPEDVAITTTYTDYNGRTIQTVSRQASPKMNDVVIPVVYDKFGRRSAEYLPYVQLTNNRDDGKYKDSMLLRDSLFYHNLFPEEDYNFSRLIYDASPLQRILNTTAPGNSWAGQNKGRSALQWANSKFDSVYYWTIDITGENDLPVTENFYIDGSLIAEQVTDEDGKRQIMYKDEFGHIVLTRIQVLPDTYPGHTGWLSTYYVYDEAGMLRFVIPPKAVEELILVNLNLNANPGIISGLCYSYFYDHKGRVIAKHIPGQGKTYIAYDLFGRTVMLQDEKQRAENKWAFIKYDEFNRPVMSGTITTPLNKDSIINQASVSNDYPVLTSGYEVFSETYYDEYRWADATELSATIDSSHINENNFNFSLNNGPDYAQPISVTQRIRGMATGAKVRILGTNDFLYSLFLYDDFGRVVQAKGTNITGGLEVSTMQYSFSGKTLSSHFFQSTGLSNAQQHTVSTKYSYDHAGRLLGIDKNIDSTGRLTIATMEYNELGQLTKKIIEPGFDGSELETQNYEYNIRGWLLGVNRLYLRDETQKTYFGYELGYNDTLNTLMGTSYQKALFNGSITGTAWRSKGDGELRKYDYSYDAAGRLLSAAFTQFNNGSFNLSAGIDFSVKMGNGQAPYRAYDANGNILFMLQQGLKLGSSATIDRLTYSYSSASNKLAKVTDAVIDPNSKLGDFKDGANTTADDYVYDVNGNLTKDGNKGIDTIFYNHLNLPEFIDLGDKGTVTYSYNAAGLRLKKQVFIRASHTTITSFYLSGFVYETKQQDSTVIYNTKLLFCGHEEGRIRALYDSLNRPDSITGFAYDYFIKDHLGNIRVVITDDIKVDKYPPASMETAQAATEEAIYANLPQTRSQIPPGYPTDTYTSPNNYVAKVSGSGNRIGPSITLKVMAGDKFNLRVTSWYKLNGATPGNPVNPLPDLIAALLNGVGGAAAGIHGASIGTQLQSSNILTPGATQFLNSQTYNSSKPRAYINWILFDEQFKYASGGFEQVAANEELKEHIFNHIEITKTGYLYVYVSNATPNVDVFFDNLQVTHERGPLLETNEYYPFGLLMKNISYRSLRGAGFAENKYKFNAGTELNEALDVHYYETPLRNYDPQIGRFNCIDVMAEHYFGLTPYQFAGNNPVSFNDPFGDQMKANGRMQKGPDGNYHIGWYSEILWNNYGFYKNEFSEFESTGGGGSEVFYNVQGLSSKAILQQMKFGDRFGQNSNGVFGFWRAYAYDPTNRGYQEAGATPDKLAEVTVGSTRKWEYIENSGIGNWANLDNSIREIYENAEYLEVSAAFMQQYVELHTANSRVLVTLSTNKGSMQILTNAATYKGLTKSIGAIGKAKTVADIWSNIVACQEGEISGVRAGYRITGSVSSLLAPVIYGAVTGSNAGPYGTLAGVVVGVSFVALEIGYDQIAVPIYNQIVSGLSSWESSLRAGRIPW
ncbi:MAG: hypothetical protein JST57_09085, partial [Bacteroidetes bacterium]|nr:hypothetical protein [Bacteroidota bacterium]